MKTEDSIYTTIRAYKNSRSLELDYKIISNDKYPCYLVPIAAKYLFKSNKKIPMYLINSASGIRYNYLVKLYIKQEELGIFGDARHIESICDHYKKLGKNHFLETNIVLFTKRFLSFENIENFVILWNLFDTEKQKLFNDYISFLKITNLEKTFVEKIYEGIDEFLNIDFYISNEIFGEKFYYHPKYQLKIVVKLLKSNDIEEKRKLLEFPIYFCFEKIIKCNLSIFDIQEEIKIISYEQILDKIDFYNEKIAKDKQIYIPTKFINEYDFINNIKFIYSEFDNLEIRKILYFLKNNSVNEEWHNYFLEPQTLKNYDQHFILKQLFGKINYDISFSKMELIIIEAEMKKLLNNTTKTLYLYFLSAKNPSFKNFLKTEVEKLINLRNFDHNFFTNELAIFVPKNDENFLEYESQNYRYFLYKCLIRIGAHNFTQLFDLYYENDKLLFFGVFCNFLKDNKIDLQIYKNLFEKELIEIKKEYYNNNFDNKLLYAILIESFHMHENFPIDFILENLENINPDLINSYAISTILNHFSNIEDCINFFLEKRYSSLKSINTKQEQTLYKMMYIDIFNIHTNANLNPFDEIYVFIISEVINYSIKNNATMKITKEFKSIPKNKITNLDNFYAELIYGNKSTNLLVNIFYMPKDIYSKLYLPKAWKIYFKRNKLENLNTFLHNKKTQINQIHLLCICAALYNNENSPVIINFVNTIKNTNQEVLFYKFIFLYYALKNKSSVLENVFLDLIKYCQTKDNIYIASLIYENYNIKITESEKTNLIIDFLKKLDISNLEPSVDREIISNIFLNFEPGDRDSFNVFEALRIIDCTDVLHFTDKSGIQKILFNNIDDDPNFYLAIFNNLYNVEDMNWIMVEKYIKENQYIEQIIKLILKHKNIINYDKIIALLKKTELFYEYKELINLLNKDEILDLAKNREFCNLKFFENINNIDILSFSEIQNDNSPKNYYAKNHFNILKNFATKNEIKIKNKCCQNYYRNITYCSLVNLENNPNYLDIFCNNLTYFNFDIPYDYEKLRNAYILNGLSACFLTKKCKNVLDLLNKILGEEKYFYPIILESFGKIPNLYCLEDFENVYLYLN
ncbi:hypothetical protein COBT_000534 [Conglomerata obtusa]